MPESIRFRAFLYAGIIILVYILLLFGGMLLGGGEHTTVCVFKNLTGIPCAGCGLGRATISLFHLDIIESFRYHILAIPITVGILTACIWLIVDGIMKRDTFFATVNPLITKRVFIFFIVLTLCSWTVNIVRGI